MTRTLRARLLAWAIRNPELAGVCTVLGGFTVVSLTTAIFLLLFH